MGERILVAQHLVNGTLQVVERTMETIGNRQLLEMQPETLNRIEKRAVLGQPEDQDAVFEQRQRCLGCLAVVVGGIIHDENQSLARVGGDQMFEKVNEGFAVLAWGGERIDKARMPVVGAKDVQIVWAAWGGNKRALSAACPAAAQRRMQAHGRFVHKEELGLGDGVEGDVFFNQSNTWAAVSCAGRSCR